MAALLRCHSHTMQFTQLKGTSQRILVHLGVLQLFHSLIPEHSIQGLGAGVRGQGRGGGPSPNLLPLPRRQHLRDPHHWGSRGCPPLTPIHGLAAEVWQPPMWWGAPVPELGADSCPLPDPAVSDPAPPHHAQMSPDLSLVSPFLPRRWVWRDLSQL